MVFEYSTKKPANTLEAISLNANPATIPAHANNFVNTLSKPRTSSAKKTPEMSKKKDSK